MDLKFYLSKDVSVEITFIGQPTMRHIDALILYIDIWKSILTSELIQEMDNKDK